MDRKPARLDLDAFGEVWAKKNSGADLLQTVAAYGGERTIRFRGQCVLPQQLALDVENTVIEGISRSGTKISLASGVNDSAIKVSAANCELRKFTVDGNRTGQAGTSHGIYVYRSAGHRIENLKILNCLTEGIHIGEPTWESCLGGFIDKCYIGDTANPNYGSGVFLDFSATDWHVTNSVIAKHTQAGKAGIDVMGSSNKIEIVHLWGNYYNIQLGKNTGTARSISRLRIVGCGIMDNMRHGIFKTAEAHTWRGGTISGNTFWRNGEETAGTYDSINCAVGGGTVRSVPICGNQFLGAVEDIASPVKKTLNAITDNGLMTYCTIVGNTINNYLTADPINVTGGATNEEGHNTLYNCAP